MSDTTRSESGACAGGSSGGTPVPVAVPRYAALYRLPRVRSDDTDGPEGSLVSIAQSFSPRYECCGDDLVVIDITGLERLFAARGPRPGVSRAPVPVISRTRTAQMGPGGKAVNLERPGGHGGPDDHEGPDDHDARVVAIGEELVRAIREGGFRGQVAIAGTYTAAVVLARARPGLTLVASGREGARLAPVPIDVLVPIEAWLWPSRRGAAARQASDEARRASLLASFTRWGLRTLGDLATLPPAEVTARLGRHALVWHALARGEDVRPLVPTEPEERFEGALDLEWPIDTLEPLSFVLTRLLEPLSTRLERRDRGAATLHVLLELVTREVDVRRLQLPTPIRDVRTLRTLALLDIEAHRPAAAIDRVEVVIDPTPGRVLQHTLFTRAVPTPERLSTLLARLGALMGQDRLGAPVVVDTHRPGAFAMQPFATAPKVASHPSHPPGGEGQTSRSSAPSSDWRATHTGLDPQRPVSALRRCRQPVPARVVLEGARPVRVTTDRRGFCGGAVVAAAGPWRSSGWWWASAGSALPAWNRDEWEVALSDGAVYRVFLDRESGGWFIDGVFD